MIHLISKKYGISRHESEKYSEAEFWEMIAFENLDRAKEEYIINGLKFN